MLTKIDYLDHTWNPMAMRCTQVSPACDNCWHLPMAARKAGNPKLSDLERRASAGLIPPVLMPDRLAEPLRLKKPQRIGVQFMGDLFHEAVGDLDIYRIFDVMARCQNQTFVCLTKRPQRMLDFCRRLRFIPTTELAHLAEPGVSYNPNGPVSDSLPLPNVWLGVTLESQNYKHRVVDLLQTPAAIRFVSVEPGLGVVDLSPWLRPNPGCSFVDPEDGCCTHPDTPDPECHIGSWCAPTNHQYRGLNWVICGGETGPRARPMHPDIPRKLRDDSVAAGVPYFFKSWGEWAPGSDARKKVLCVYNDGRAVEFTQEAILAEEKRSGLEHNKFSPLLMSHVGKKAAGRLLDGRTWDEVPGVAL